MARVEGEAAAMLTGGANGGSSGSSQGAGGRSALSHEDKAATMRVIKTWRQVEFHFSHFASNHIYTYIFIYVYTCVYTFMYVCISICLHMYIYVYI